ncbi:MAG: hypothetical protein PHP32_07140 [Candidatus Izemoplasmatales bacterium]|nr:hypothetical protein [Candidatus Izemoplasmatales bacterium]
MAGTVVNAIGNSVTADLMMEAKELTIGGLVGLGYFGIIERNSVRATILVQNALRVTVGMLAGGVSSSKVMNNLVASSVMNVSLTIPTTVTSSIGGMVGGVSYNSTLTNNLIYADYYIMSVNPINMSPFVGSMSSSAKNPAHLENNLFSGEINVINYVATTFQLLPSTASNAIVSNDFFTERTNIFVNSDQVLIDGEYLVSVSSENDGSLYASMSFDPLIWDFSSLNVLFGVYPTIRP